MARTAVPLGRGMVPWPEVVACLRRAGFDGWISVHREYGAQTPAAVCEDVRGDVAFLRALLSGS